MLIKLMTKIEGICFESIIQCHVLALLLKMSYYYSSIISSCRLVLVFWRTLSLWHNCLFPAPFVTIPDVEISNLSDWSPVPAFCKVRHISALLEWHVFQLFPIFLGLHHIFLMKKVNKINYKLPQDLKKHFPHKFCMLKLKH